MAYKITRDGWERVDSITPKSVRDREIFVKCPVCGGRTASTILPETVMEEFPLFCPKCTNTSLISKEAW